MANFNGSPADKVDMTGPQGTAVDEAASAAPSSCPRRGTGAAG